MGLLLNNVETNFGFSLNNVYVKVLIVSTTKEECNFKLGFFTTKEYADNGKMPFKTLSEKFSSPDVSTNIWEQIYIYCKTLPEFSGATDLV